MHLQSLRNFDVKTIWENDIHPHYIIRCYAELIASLMQLNCEYGDNQVSLTTSKFILIFFFSFLQIYPNLVVWRWLILQTDVMEVFLSNLTTLPLLPKPCFSVFIQGKNTWKWICVLGFKFYVTVRRNWFDLGQDIKIRGYFDIWSL